MRDAVFPSPAGAIEVCSGKTYRDGVQALVQLHGFFIPSGERQPLICWGDK